MASRGHREGLVSAGVWWGPWRKEKEEKEEAKEGEKGVEKKRGRKVSKGSWLGGRRSGDSPGWEGVVEGCRGRRWRRSWEEGGCRPWAGGQATRCWGASPAAPAAAEPVPGPLPAPPVLPPCSLSGCTHHLPAFLPLSSCSCPCRTGPAAPSCLFFHSCFFPGTLPQGRYLFASSPVAFVLLRAPCSTLCLVPSPVSSSLFHCFSLSLDLPFMLSPSFVFPRSLFFRD